MIKISAQSNKYFVRSRLIKSHHFLPVLLPEGPLLGLLLDHGDFEIDIFIPHRIPSHHRRLPRFELSKTVEKKFLEF